jgi:hypothetical protein
MAEIWYLVTSFIKVPHIVGSVFGSIRFLLPVCRLDFYTHWTYILYMPIFSHIFLSNYWWQKSDIWSQASYRYPISWEAFLDLSDSYFLFAEEWGYHKWALAHSSSCFTCFTSAIWLKSHISLFWYVVACEWPYVITFTIQWKWHLADMKTL